MIDNSKFGEAVAKTMDRLDALRKRGDITDDFELNEVLVIAAMSRPSPEADDIESDKVEVLIFVDGSTQLPFVQIGILEMAIDTVNVVVVGDE